MRTRLHNILEALCIGASLFFGDFLIADGTSFASALVAAAAAAGVLHLLRPVSGDGPRAVLAIAMRGRDDLVPAFRVPVAFFLCWLAAARLAAVVLPRPLILFAHFIVTLGALAVALVTPLPAPTPDLRRNGEGFDRVGVRVLRDGLCHVWYPAAAANPADGRRQALLMPGRGSKIFARTMDFLPVPSWLAGFLELAEGSSLVDAAPADLPSQNPKGFPVVYFTHGSTGVADVYSAICENIARRGFVVVAPTHTDGSSALDFAELPEWKSQYEEYVEVRRRQTLVRLRDLDEARDAAKAAGIPGAWADPSVIVAHSLGCTVAAAAVAMGRHAGLVSLDGYVSEAATRALGGAGPRAPLPRGRVAILNSDGVFQWPNNLARLRELARNDGDGTLWRVRGSAHHSFNDMALLAPVFCKLIALKSPYFTGRANPEDVWSACVDAVALVARGEFAADKVRPKGMLYEEPRDG